MEKLLCYHPCCVCPDHLCHLNYHTKSASAEYRSAVQLTPLTLQQREFLSKRQNGPTIAEAGGSPIYLTEIPPGYRDWRLISVAHEEGTLDDIRAIGNDIAVKS